MNIYCRYIGLIPFKRFNFIFLLLPLLNFSCSNKQNPDEVSELNTKLASGWNTWNTRSVLSYVLLPECFSVDLQLLNKETDSTLKESLIGRRGPYKEIVTPGPHSYDGSYSQLTVSWKDMEIMVQSSGKGKEFALIVTPLMGMQIGDLLIKPGVLWGRSGSFQIKSGSMVYSKDQSTRELYIKTSGNIEMLDSMVKCPLTGKIYISTSANMGISEIEGLISDAEKNQVEKKKKFGADSMLYDAMQTVLAWDIIYEPVHKRVIAPVSRIWNCNWNGWVLFDWDTYFASYMFSLDNKELAYSNAIAITKEITEKGFIPNFGSGICTSDDRSQPPVGSYIVWEIFKKYHEKWFLKEVFDELLSWNRWWEKNRDIDNYMCWGSDPYNSGSIPEWLSREVGKKQGAMWESGLDNSPMYDEATFDTISHKLMLADVGLLSMFIWDCKNLSKIATELGRKDILNELNLRVDKYSKSLESLWDENTGMYLNKDLTNGKLSPRISPTNFYPLLSGVPSPEKAERMINEHFYNQNEFWGEWIIPSISRNDRAFADNTYWRGRIWAPMNMLVYIGLRNYDLPMARKDLAEKSSNLLSKSWSTERHVYENYNSVTGIGDDVTNSDKFYHWGALLAYIKLLEKQDTSFIKNQMSKVRTTNKQKTE